LVYSQWGSKNDDPVWAVTLCDSNNTIEIMHNQYYMFFSPFYIKEASTLNIERLIDGLVCSH
jgi:hypothetical protein